MQLHQGIYSSRKCISQTDEKGYIRLFGQSFIIAFLTSTSQQVQRINPEFHFVIFESQCIFWNNTERCRDRVNGRLIKKRIPQRVHVFQRIDRMLD